MSSDAAEVPPGLVISVTEPIREFLLSASEDPHLHQQLREFASNLASQSSVPYRQIRTIWPGSKAETRPELIRLFSGSHFVFTSPKPREKSEELKARLRKLAEMNERKEYN